MSEIWKPTNHEMPAVWQRIDVWIQAIDHAFRLTDICWSGTAWVIVDRTENKENWQPLDNEYMAVEMAVTHWMKQPDAPNGFKRGHGRRGTAY